MVECEIPTLQTQHPGNAIRAYAFTDNAPPLTPAQIKRLRYVQNLQKNHQRLIEALGFVERFAAICELSEERIFAIRKSKDDAIAELTMKFEEKLKTYDGRIAGGGGT
jgi:hypothetical protein